jgi:hypothetical protein
VQGSARLFCKRELYAVEFPPAYRVSTVVGCFLVESGDRVNYVRDTSVDGKEKW